MRLKKVEVQNWYGFRKAQMDCHSFSVFLGGTNTGKSAFMKALLSALQLRHIRKGEIQDERIPFEIVLHFKRKKNEQQYFSLKIRKKARDKIRFFQREALEWRECSREEYQEALSDLTVFYLPSHYELSYLDYLFGQILEKLEKKEQKIWQEYQQKYQRAKEQRASQGYYRHLFIELLQRTQASQTWNNTILLWEEPEFYLSPQQERACYDSLRRHSEQGLLVMVSTNSSRFIELEDYASLCLFQRKDEEISIYQYRGNLFSGDEVVGFNMNYWLNPDRSELFFANKVILVEGQTDKMIISYLAKKLGIFDYSYSVIECGSKSVIPQFIRLLNAFHIPYVAVYDKDQHHWRNETELFNSQTKNRQIQKLIHSSLGSYVEFENDIEEEIYASRRERNHYKNKPFYALMAVMEKDYVMPRGLEEKIRNIYR